MAETKIIERLDRGYSYMATEDGVTRVGTVVDVSDVAEAVKERRAMGLTEQVFGRHEFSIPLEQLDAWAKKISNGALNAFDVSSDDALLDRFMSEHGCYKVHKGWQ